MTGQIADIQRCSVHDGPGLRTTFFFKGCPLQCPWCHNPECISPEPELLLYPEKCIGCGQCEQGCFAGAKVLCGRSMSVEEALREALADAPYYGELGGVTLSGGEPLMQPDFLLALTKACIARKIPVALETSFAAPWHNAAELLPMCQLVMADLKHADDALHAQWTGQDAVRIRENLLRADALGVPLVLRTPIVPGVNAEPETIARIATFARDLRSLAYYELLPYHPLGQSKALATTGASPTHFDTPSAQHVHALADIAVHVLSMPVRIAGKPFSPAHT